MSLVSPVLAGRFFTTAPPGKPLDVVPARPRFDPCVRKNPRRIDRLPTPVFKGFPGGSDGRESACNVEGLVSTPGLGRSSGGGHGYPLQYCGLESPHGQRSLVGLYGVAKSQKRLSN